MLVLSLTAAGCARLPAVSDSTSQQPDQNPVSPSSRSTVTRNAVSKTAAPLPTLSLIPSLTPESCFETQGTILEESFRSAITRQPFHYRIYLPPCYVVSGRRYPVLFLLHGFDPQSEKMNDDQWGRLGVGEVATAGFLAGQTPAMIIVMPNGNDAYYGDDTSDSPFPQIVVQEMIPWIDSHYCTWGDATGRAIGGLSRGGYWAIYIAFRFPQLFSRLGAHSPYLYAPYDWTSANPFNLVDSAVGIESLSMYFDHGTNDYASVVANTGEFVRRIEQRGIAVQYVVSEGGGHVEAYWSAHVAEYLAFYSAAWPTDVGEYPLCVKRP